MILMVS